MKIYTRTGDDGTTGLIGGQRVRKSDARIECIGAIDELNAAIGLCTVSADSALLAQLRAVQNDLFIIGAHLGTADAAGPAASIPPLDESIIARLELEIDSADRVLPALRNFILPGGSEPAARLHWARTICRRAERQLVDFSPEHAIPAIILMYLNRLSDWLFVQARLVNYRSGTADIPWNR